MTLKSLLWGSLLVAVLLVVGGFVYANRTEPPPSLAERCSGLGGEWIYKSKDMLCLLPTGKSLAYQAAIDDFVTYDPYAADLASLETPVTRSDVPAPIMGEAASCEADPEFSDYLTSESFTGRPNVDFDTFPEAEHYRTAIRKDVARGVNFAGKYVVSTWGCGEGCVGSAVVNAESGKILAYGLTATGYLFKADSRLLKAREQGDFVIEGDELNQTCK